MTYEIKKLKLYRVEIRRENTKQALDDEVYVVATSIGTAFKIIEQLKMNDRMQSIEEQYKGETFYTQTDGFDAA